MQKRRIGEKRGGRGDWNRTCGKTKVEVRVGLIWCAAEEDKENRDKEEEEEQTAATLVGRGRLR